MLGAAYGSGEYVVSNERGEPYSPGVLSRYWNKIPEDAGVRHIKLHGGRHSCATLMTLAGIAVVVVAEWIGHTDPSLVYKLYAHSQDAALKAAAQSFDRVVSRRVTERPFEHLRTASALVRVELMTGIEPA